ncbi:hypothetical protein ACHAWF_006921 [Thalassiosira exigua]
MGPGHTVDYGGSSFSTDRADGRDVSAAARGSGGMAASVGAAVASSEQDYSGRGSFGDAFAAAHNDMGPGHAFTYAGKSYSTNRADGRDFSHGSRHASSGQCNAQERKGAIYSSLKEEFGHAGAAAVLANIAHETGETFDYHQKQVKGTAFGLVKMEPPMKEDYDKFRSQKNKVDSPQSQVDYIVDQLRTGKYIGAGNAAKIRSAIGSGDIVRQPRSFVTGSKGLACLIWTSDLSWHVLLTRNSKSEQFLPYNFFFRKKMMCSAVLIS